MIKMLGEGWHISTKLKTNKEVSTHVDSHGKSYLVLVSSMKNSVFWFEKEIILRFYVKKCRKIASIRNL